MSLTTFNTNNETFNNFLKKVEKMRFHQNNWFRHRSRNDLHAAKNLEREVDILIEQIKKDNLQPRLF